MRGNRSITRDQQKKKLITKETFVGRPDRACSTDSFRPAMTLIYCHKGNFVATDGHILVMIPIEVKSLTQGLSDEMTEKAKENLEGYLIHPSQFRELLRYNLLKFDKPGEIRAIKVTGETAFETIFKFQKPEEMDLKFPDYEHVTKFEPGEVDEIGFNETVFHRLISCFEGLPGYNNWKLAFQAKNKAIHVTSDQEENKGFFGLIMPVMLNNYV